jgi:cytoskeletal protein RodZ
VQELTRVRSQAEARETDTLQKIATLRTTVDELTRARSDAEQRLSKLRQTKAKEIVRSVSPFVIAAAVATVGIWTYQLIWPAPQPLPAVMSGSMEEAEQQRLKEEVQRQTKAAADADTKRQAAEKAAADADSKRKAAEAEQHGLKEEVQRQAKAVAEVQTRLQAAQTELQIQSKAATDADTTRKVAGEQQSLTLCRAEDATSLTGPFTKLCGVQATGAGIATGFQASLDECEQKCAGTYNCRVFTRNKLNGMCYLYNWVDYTSNSQFDSGERNSDRTTIRVDEMPTGINPFDNISANTLAECEAACVRSPKCKLFTRVKDGRCFLYQRPSGSFSQVQGYETGLLKARMR